MDKYASPIAVSFSSIEQNVRIYLEEAKLLEITILLNANAIRERIDHIAVSSIPIAAKLRKRNAEELRPNPLANLE